MDHDIHWRTGLSPKGEETFTPRCIIYDLKGSFGPLPKVNSLYEASDNGVEAASWLVMSALSLADVWCAESGNVQGLDLRLSIGSHQFVSASISEGWT